MRGLLIAEKPSQMRAIQEVYDKHKSQFNYDIDFTCQRGHLLTLKLPDELDESMKQKTWDNLPFFPKQWEYKVIEEKKTGNFLTAEERYKKIREAIESGRYDFIIHSGDPDQEGELLVNIVLAHIGNVLPVARFWTNDMTEGAILNALKHLRNDRTDPQLINLLNAAYVRQHSDYLFGMNISRAASLKMNTIVACGRVKTFMQSVVVQREDAIKNFVPHTVYGVKSIYADGNTGVMFNPSEKADEEKGEEAGTIWYETKEEAEKTISSLGRQATVVSYEKKTTKTYAPKLFKLSTAQTAAGKAGYTPQQVLDTIQSLYEKKLLSYPRTACEYVGSDEDFRGILYSMAGIPELRKYLMLITPAEIERVRHSKKWVNDKELQSQGHTALRPTTAAPDLDKLTSDEKFIYLMIAKRFIAIFLQPSVAEEAKMTAVNNGMYFRSSSKATIFTGYMDIFNQKPENSMTMPEYRQGQIIDVDHFDVAEKTSKCPSHLTEADLIAICENPAKYLDDKRLAKLGKRLKIGTEATRAGIITQLKIKNHYLENRKEGKKEYIFPTARGEAIARNLDGLLITRADMTGEWEMRLESVREGNADPNAVESAIREDMVRMMDEIKSRQMNMIENTGPNSRVTKYVCPFCGGKIIETEKTFHCENNRYNDPDSCQFFIMRKPKMGGTVTLMDIRNLCEKGKTAEKTFKSLKTGKSYHALLVINREKKCIDIGFAPKETGLTCPVCGKTVIRFSKGYKCSNESCHFLIWEKPIGCTEKINEKQIEKLIKTGKTDVLKFKSKAGKPYSAYLKLKADGTVEREFA